MTKRERAALALERKILGAIESGEFTPAFGYLRQVVYVPKVGEMGANVVLGPCGCALAAAAFVNGIKGNADVQELVAFLGRTVGLSENDARALERGYEGGFWRVPNPYFQVGKRLRRFHPAMNRSVE